MSKLRIVIGGYIGLIPAGGVTWDYIQYPLGFRSLGHDVYYIEDTRLYPVYQGAGSNWNDASTCVQHLKNVMEYFGMHDHWGYRDEASGECFGLSAREIAEICASADVFINISCSTFLRDEYRSIPVRILIDSDPMFTQIQYESGQMFTAGKSGIRELIDGHNFHFTFGENIGAEECRIPVSAILWQPTRQPICLDYWQPSPPVEDGAFTTLMNWSAGKPLLYGNEEWGQKDEEFLKIQELPRVIPGIKVALGIAQTVAGNRFNQSALEGFGWEVLDPAKIAADWLQYKDFIRSSAGEFSVAKHTYVKARTGWFSCRSACYLAASRPVIVQETGWSGFIPSGRGAIAFSDQETAVDALKKITKDRAQHSRWARELAADYFDSDKVLASLLDCTN